MHFIKHFPVFLLLPLLILSVCATATAAPRADGLPAGTLDRPETLALFMDQTVESVTLGKSRVSISYYSPTGEVRQIRDGQKRSGLWRVNKNGRMCLTMEGGKEKCRILVREADGRYQKYVVKKSGAHKPVVGYRSFEKGNTRGL